MAGIAQATDYADNTDYEQAYLAEQEPAGTPAHGPA